MGIVVVGVGSLLLAVGLISLIRPLNMLRVSSRKEATVVFVSGLIVLGIGGFLTDTKSVQIPKPGPSKVDQRPKAVASARPTPRLTGEQYYQRAKRAYAEGRFEAAKVEIDRALARSPGNARMLALKRQIGRKLQAIEAKRLKEEQAQLLRSMVIPEGRPLGVAVAQVKLTRRVDTDFSYYTAAKGYQFLWLFVAVKNFSDRTVHANPNYFTLSSPGGLTFNPDTQTTYSQRHFDAIDVPPDGISGGWLIFHVPIEKEYTLHMNAFSNQATKRIFGVNWKLK